MNRKAARRPGNRRARCCIRGRWPACKNNPRTCGSGLARDADNSVHLNNRGAAIAGKPAPTGLVVVFSPC
ncbi:hypothetical protein EU514_02810 [Pseudomonas fragi]|nr:hypothetical protein [Pseudomonas fragi]